jgi:hypothetical protein
MAAGDVGVLRVVSLALLGLAGAFLLGAEPLSLIFTLGGFVAARAPQTVAKNTTNRRLGCLCRSTR